MLLHVFEVKWVLLSGGDNDYDFSMYRGIGAGG
jgi:hypothetical protein